jgi:ABC-type branched-subunit amino acid transport system ATPase component
MPTLTLSDVRAGYGSISVLNGVTFSVGEGETLALLGANGSGKSTVLKTIMGLTSFYDGSITWDGSQLNRLATWRLARGGIGYLPQIKNIFPGLSVRENLSLAGYLARARKPPPLTEVYDIFPDLARLAGTKAGNLSGGERRMVAIGSLLLQRPSLLLLDEPTSDLAPATAAHILETIETIVAARKIPLVLVEQNVDRALSVCTKVSILRRGAVVLTRDVRSISSAEIGAVFLEDAETAQ